MTVQLQQLQQLRKTLEAQRQSLEELEGTLESTIVCAD